MDNHDEKLCLKAQKVRACLLFGAREVEAWGSLPKRLYAREKQRQDSG